jgi:asparagine synthase (glutamine-hydrolysing)
MSGISAIFNLDGKPVDRELLRRISDVVSDRGPDGSGLFVDGPIGLGHRMLRTTPESLGEEQPLADETGDLVVTLDGRIDNRDELKAAAQAKGVSLRTGTDSELLLRAYQLWGDDCASRIIGDFAFVIWDRRCRRLLAARDPLGIRPFYYYADAKTFRCGSELRQILEDSAIRREPNEGMVAEYLSAYIVNTEETLYKGIFRLPPCHLLTIEAGKSPRTKRYWDIDPASDSGCRSDEQYAERFLELFKEAVRCRLRARGPIGSDLSGGLDSSSVVVMAHALYRSGEASNLGFETFSQMFPPGPSDEAGYIDDVVRMWNVKANRIRVPPAEACAYLETVRRSLDFPSYPNAVGNNALRALARSKEMRVNLTGHGGDDRVGRSMRHYADLLRQGQLARFIQQARWEASKIGARAALGRALSSGVAPLLPVALRRAVRSVREWNKEFFPWIDPQLARRVNLIDRLQATPALPSFPTFAQQDVYKEAFHGTNVHALEMEERSDAWFGLEARHPFQDRRIVEFSVQMPELQRWRENQQKFVLRQAMRGLLPESVRQRGSKGDFTNSFHEAFSRLGGETLFDQLSIEQLGWIDGKRARKMLRLEIDHDACIEQSQGCINHCYPVWMVTGVNLWFKTVFLGSGL